MTALDLRHGRCLDVLRTLPDASVDACVTDPPYAMGREPTLAELVAYLQGADLSIGDFMGADWDLPSVPTWREVLRVLKPGAHLLAFSAPRTHDLVAIGIRAAGFEIRDSIEWLFARGWAKGLNVSKAIDAHLGAEREVIGVRADFAAKAAKKRIGVNPFNTANADGSFSHPETVGQLTAPATDDARRWDGWATQLKPAHEPVILARKPLVGTVVENVLAHGTGGLNIDACRIPVHDDDYAKNCSGDRGHADNRSRDMDFAQGCGRANDAGRYPADVVFTHAPECRVVGQKRVRAGNSVTPSGQEGGVTFQKKQEVVGQHYAGADGMETVDEWLCVEGCPIGELNLQSGVLKSGGKNVRRKSGLGYKGIAYGTVSQPSGTEMVAYGDEGYAARFFYCTKASVEERERGLDHLEPANGERRNDHPTVKPLALMTWLVQLVCPPGGLVLDPYCGSGTTGLAASRLGMRFLGIEKDEAFVRIARARMEEDSPLFNRGRVGGEP